jgi:hypothetical protein
MLWLTLFSASRAAATPAPRYRKVIAPPGVFDDKEDGVTRLHDYGAFALYAIDVEAAGSFSGRANQAFASGDELDMIYLDAYPFNGRFDTLILPEALRFDSVSGSALQLIQFIGPIKEAWLEAVRDAGGIPIHYIANNAYLVWADGRARAQLDAMVQDGRFLQYSSPYQPYFKLGPQMRLRAANRRNDAELVTVSIQMLRHPQQGNTERMVEANRFTQHSPWTAVLRYQNSVVTMRMKDVIALANRPDTVWIGLYSAPVLVDEVQAQIVAGNLEAGGSGPASPGYLAWLDSYGFSQNPADYPIVDISDDGVGNGTLDSGDPTLHQYGDIAAASRLQYVTNCTAAADGGGIGGHGHINASIAGGYDDRAGSPFRDGDGYQRGLGVNPYVRLGSTRLFAAGAFDLSGCSSNLSFIIEQIYANGARISSNSWGCDTCATTYDPFSQLYDARTRDADTFQSGNQALTFVFGAGNSGPLDSTIYTPGNGKNVITVGGSENDRAFGGFFDGCGINDSQADNAMDIIGFSSRGPAPGGRIKPEIVAPATHVQGTSSTHPGFDGSTVCDPFQPITQTVYASSSGTSHATPAVSGVLSLVSYWLENTYGFADPSPALLKAYLLAHPAYLTGVDAGDTLPSNVQGYGMPDMGLAFNGLSRFIVDQSMIFDNTGETKRFTVAVSSSVEPLRIVMAYTDQAGAVGTSPQVNSLSLRAMVSGTTYLGNQFSGQWSIAGGSADMANNYEAIFLPAGVTGTVSITVTAFNIAGDGVPSFGDGTDQDFALVCYNCEPADDFLVQVAPADQSICLGDDALYTVNLDRIGGYTDPVSLSLSGAPAGTSHGFQPTAGAPPFTSTMVISNSGAAAAGDYRLTVSGSGTVGIRSTAAWLHLEDTLPGPITLTSPISGAVNVALTPTFTWTASSPAPEFQLEVATDPGMSNVVYRAVVPGNSHMLDGQLVGNTMYYWRVRTANACGSSVSQLFNFRTLAPPPAARILLVDGDWDILYGDVRPAYTNALDGLGISYDIWDMGSTGVDPDLATLLQYDQVIWFSGDARDLIGPPFNIPFAGPTPGGESALGSYLRAGGCFLISSMEYFTDRGLTSFMANYLGTAAAANGSYTTTLGVGPVYAGLGPYGLAPSIVTPDRLTPDSTALVGFSGNAGEDGGISKDAGVYRSSYLGFGLEDVPSGPGETLDAFLTWCTNKPLLTIDDPSAPEPSGSITFTLSLTPTASTFDVSVSYVTTNSTAIAGSDYLTATGSITLPAGTISHTVSVNLLDDAAGEGDETFSLILSNATNILIADDSGQGTIVDDEVPTAVSLAEAGVRRQLPPAAAPVLTGAWMMVTMLLLRRLRRGR